MPADALVGRRLTVDALRSAVDAAMAGVGGVVLLAGEAGMGKTALAAEAAAYAKARGAVAVWGTCWEGEGAPGFWPWIQVVRALAAGVGAAGQAVLAALTGAAGVKRGSLGDESAARFRTYDMAATYLRERAAERPLAVVVDDLHWADVSSLRLLVFLARQLHDAAILVIGTYRDVEVAAGDHPARPLLAELAGQAELLEPAGLSAGEVGRLIEQVCGEPPPAALAQAVHDRTAGNPFFTRQIARLLVAQGVPLVRALVGGVPPAAGDVLLRRLARLPREVVDLLAAAAVIGRHVPIAMASAVVGLPAEDAVPLVESAVRAGVLERDEPGRVRFSHDLFRDVLVSGLPTARRSALHLEVAGLLEQHVGPAAPAAEIAYHRSMAWPLGERDRLIAALAEAGREATARTAFDEAAVHLRRAVEIAGGHAAAEVELLCDYGDALRRAGHGEDAQAAWSAAAARARAAGDTARFARAAFGAHRVSTITDSSRSGVIALLEEALAALDETNAAGRTERWLLSASLARELADGPDRDLPRAVGLARDAVEGARAAGDAGTLAYTLFALADVRWAPGSAAERLRIAGELAAAATAARETELVLEAHLCRLVALLELGEPSFTVELATFTRLAEQAAIPRYVYLARSRQATAASLTGPLEAADQLIDDAAAYGERIGEPDTWGVQASQLAGLAYIRHDWTRLSKLAAARGQALTPPEFTLHMRAWLHLEAGDQAAATALVASIPDWPTTYRWRHTAMMTSDAELAAAVGDRHRCAARYEQLLPMAGEFAVVGAAVFTTGPVALQLGLLAAALGRWDNAAAHLDDAARRCDRLGAALLAARARTELDRVRTEAAGDGGGNMFRRDGDTWTLAFGGRSVPLRDAKGLRDLAVLLAAPGREVAATELVAGVASAAAAGLAGLGADPVLDDRARAAYQTRLARLDEELAEADTHHDIERSARLAADRDALIDELTYAAGLGGRRRRLGDVTERARTTVTARIRDVIGRIERVHPELGRHLRASIVTGARVLLSAGRDHAVEHLTIVRLDLTPSGQTLADSRRS